ncbi:hypothetical protein [Acinetobacter populi]|nr:hypothetical protein [Acinetobacter populi]
MNKKNIFILIILGLFVSLLIIAIKRNDLPHIFGTALKTVASKPETTKPQIDESQNTTSPAPNQNPSITSSTASSNEITIQPTLGTWVWRDWISDDGLFFLELRTGVWNPNGTLFYLERRGGVSLEGFQKGKNIKLKSFDAEKGLEAPAEYRIEGLLDTDKNTFTANITHYPDETTRQTIFYPAIPTTMPQPQFMFKYYGFKNPEWHQEWITRIDILDKKTQKLVQRLSGFTAQAYMVEYLDLNYDGYFDLQINVGKTVEEQKYQYYIYQPKQQNFKRELFFEQSTGSPTRYPHKKQLNFGNGILYEKQGDTWQKIPCCYAD